MRTALLESLRPALVLTTVFTLLTGLVYPGAVTLIAQALFPSAASGSLITQHGRVVGSALIGQQFSSARYFHGRSSAAGAGYDASASAGSNKGPTDSTLQAQIAERVDSAIAAGATRGEIPTDLVTASASGLDPDISPANAQWQAERVAASRGLKPKQLQAFVLAHVTPRQFGLLGEPRVNVLKLNLALDSAFPARGSGK